MDNRRRCWKKIFKATCALSLTSTMGKPYRLTKPRLRSDSTWQTSTPSITPREPNNIHFSRKRSPHPLSTSTTLSVKMVDKKRICGYSGSMGSTSTSYDTYYRCIRHRMGIPVVHRPSRLRSMDPICKPNSYKCSRVTNSSFSTTERTLNQTNIGFSAVRQFSSHTLPEQARFISVTSPSLRIRVNIQTGKEQRYSHLSFSPCRKIQPVGRFPIQTNLVISGLDLTRTPICITDNPIRETKSRPLCIPNQSTTPSICFSDIKDRGRGTRRIHPELEQMESHLPVSSSPHYTNVTSSKSTPPIQRSSSSDSSSVEVPTMDTHFYSGVQIPSHFKGKYYRTFKILSS